MLKLQKSAGDLETNCFAFWGVLNKVALTGWLPMAWIEPPKKTAKRWYDLFGDANHQDTKK